ncbi:MAG: N-acetylmuramic acid 6-phosphate etherase [Candidatus Marinimicrobia bacterium]|nr:N-acetylmuramic acid 6-phosphate etherase [Candidatus Neomarinimicrobiota bacterium]MCF7851129.1 N-acetylmuramic acid 6-phosphate etherase [Candidatus Neomarinimicrobiota bacterium]MCF7904046.1 N-acetylmuramic acid 6-phosphate etherase [Candidatus Neomarinimicrobiota bacterium]
MNSKLGKLLTEQRNPNSMHLDSSSIREILEIINREDQIIAGEVARQMDDIEAATQLVDQAFHKEGRLIYVGAGTSGRLGILDASEIPPTYNASPERVQGYIAGGDTALRTAVEGAEDFPEDGQKLMDEIGVNDQDVVMGIATSGVTPFVLGSLNRAREIGAKTVFFTCADRLHIDIDVDVLISVPVGPEVVTGSTRMKSGTATKMVLNMITTTAMIKRGKVYENLMVDLKATNIKLEDRARRIISTISGCTYEEATDLLIKAGKYVKVALVMQKTNAPVDDCRMYLDRFDGSVRDAVEALEKNKD